MSGREPILCRYTCSVELFTSIVFILVGDMYELRDETGLVIHTYPAIASLVVEPSDKAESAVGTDAVESANKQQKVFSFAALSRVFPQTAAPKTTNPLLLAALPSPGSLLTRTRTRRCCPGGWVAHLGGRPPTSACQCCRCSFSTCSAGRCPGTQCWPPCE